MSYSTASLLNSRRSGIKYQGDFEIDGIVYFGGLVIDSEDSIIYLIASAKLVGEEAKRYTPKKYARIPMIHAELEGRRNKLKATLFKCRCKDNYCHENAEGDKTLGITLEIEYVVFGTVPELDATYDRFQFTVENGLAWSNISQILVMDNPNGGAPSQVRFRGNSYYKKYIMGGSLIQFRSQIDNNELMRENRRELFPMEERLQITITPQLPSPISYFLGLRDQIVDMIAFGVKGNVNVLEQHLILGSEDDEHIDKQGVYTNKKRLPIRRTFDEYNFTLDQLPRTKDVSRALNRLEPIFRLYASFYRYEDMPLEMQFLNVTQALETMHSRFYYSAVVENADFADTYSVAPRRTTLLQRITELLEKGENQIFESLCDKELRFAERVVLSRNYYTHYQENMWQSALDSECLYDVVRILKCVLEYYICQQLGVDISVRVKEEIDKICIDNDGHPRDIFTA